MRHADKEKYISELIDMTREGMEVDLPVSDNSMSPFLRDNRDSIYLKKPSEELKRGDMVLFRRSNGKYIMHRISKITEKGYYTVGDAQFFEEGPIKREQICGIVTKVRRKGECISKGDFVWDFYENVWSRIIKLRKPFLKFNWKIASMSIR